MKILLPVDGTPVSLLAVRHALRLRSEGLASTFVLVNVQPPPTLYEVVVAHDPVLLDDVRRAAGEDLLAPAEALLEAAGVEWETEVAGGEPSHVLVDLVENYGCDFVVMGAGPLALALLQHCPVPVTVVRGTDNEAG
jgi:nucleotide-binding universal stress UspA family protein